MNLASILVFSLIGLAVAYGIFRMVRSKGACEDCEVYTCPAHEFEGK